jgi:hypothetical protein
MYTSALLEKYLFPGAGSIGGLAVRAFQTLMVVTDSIKPGLGSLLREFLLGQLRRQGSLLDVRLVGPKCRRQNPPENSQCGGAWRGELRGNSSPWVQPCLSVMWDNKFPQWCLSQFELGFCLIQSYD